MMTTPSSTSEHQGPLKANDHIREYHHEPPTSFTAKEVDKFGILYKRAFCIDCFLDGHRTKKGNLPGKKQKDKAKVILDEWNAKHGHRKDKGFSKYENLECLKSNTSHAKLEIRKMLGLVKRGVKGPTKGPAKRVAKRATKHAAKKTTVTAKKPFVASCYI